jgi:hypothetical protein
VVIVGSGIYGSISTDANWGAGAVPRAF